MNETPAVAKVAANLTEIIHLHGELHDQAIHKANDHLMPGGLAMVALGNVASLDEWSEQIEAAEHRAIAEGRKAPEIECDDWEPPLQTLLFWSESWRVVHGYPLSVRPTIAGEANFIRWALGWAWENEPRFEDFAKDIATTRRRLEDVLTAGERAERGVPCLYEECRGVRLVRKLAPGRHPETGEKVWRHTDWHCPRCKRSWDDDRYAAMVVAANEGAKVEVIDGSLWCALDHAARKVGRSVATVRTWVHRGELSVLCVIAGKRKPFVNLTDVEARHEAAKRRAKNVA